MLKLFAYFKWCQVERLKRRVAKLQARLPKTLPDQANKPKLYGQQIVVGVQEPLPLKGFPVGKARIRQRGGAVRVFIRPANGGVRQFCVDERAGAWWPAFETGSNHVIKN